MGISSASQENPVGPDRRALDFEAAPQATGASAQKGEDQKQEIVADLAGDEPDHLRATLDENPELRAAWHEAQAYRETFPTPEDARAATALLSDFNRMDALFFSGRAEDHAELARAVADLDLAAFASLVQAMNGLAAESPKHRENQAQNIATLKRQQDARAAEIASPTQAQS
ncbi:MAG TPA: hypothetical protein VEX69_02145, partial [Candidatus Limnocylindria bacterium]|nr:hypothetical protein [Candidatus Limnocylindria bacterium]